MKGVLESHGIATLLVSDIFLPIVFFLHAATQEGTILTSLLVLLENIFTPFFHITLLSTHFCALQVLDTGHL